MSNCSHKQQLVIGNQKLMIYNLMADNETIESLQKTVPLTLDTVIVEDPIIKAITIQNPDNNADTLYYNRIERMKLADNETDLFLTDPDADASLWYNQATGFEKLVALLKQTSSLHYIPGYVDVSESSDVGTIDGGNTYDNLPLSPLGYPGYTIDSASDGEGISGIHAPISLEHQTLFIRNLSGNDGYTLFNANADSDPENQFKFLSGQDEVIPSGGLAVITYDDVRRGWILVYKTASGGTGSSGPSYEESLVNLAVGVWDASAESVVISKYGNVVSIYLNNVENDISSPQINMLEAPMPAQYHPATQVNAVVHVWSNTGSSLIRQAKVTTAGQIEFPTNAGMGPGSSVEGIITYVIP